MSDFSSLTRERLNEVWQYSWKVGSSGWHLENINPHLKEYFHNFGNVETLKGKRILVPLCGKTIDMRWFYENGLSVVGIEVTEQAVREFFDENELEFTIGDCQTEGCKIYKHDERLSIYLCDLFKLDVNTLGGKFDFLWDRGSLVAMVPREHKQYWTLINSCLSNSSQALLETYEYDPTSRNGPPHAIPYNYLMEILGDTFLAEEKSRKSEDELPEEDTLRIGHDAVRVLYHLKRKF